VNDLFITKTSEYNFVYKNANTLYSKFFVIKYINSDHFRVGIIVSKKVGNSVVRHSVKRKVKEVIRNNSKIISQKFNFVLISKPNSSSASFSSLNKDLYINLVKKIGGK
jgi:ribonuclease P protein component